MFERLIRQRISIPIPAKLYDEIAVLLRASGKQETVDGALINMDGITLLREDEQIPAAILQHQAKRLS